MVEDQSSADIGLLRQGRSTNSGAVGSHERRVMLEMQCGTRVSRIAGLFVGSGSGGTKEEVRRGNDRQGRAWKSFGGEDEDGWERNTPSKSHCQSLRACQCSRLIEECNNKSLH